MKQLEKDKILSLITTAADDVLILLFFFFFSEERLEKKKSEIFENAICWIFTQRAKH